MLIKGQYALSIYIFIDYKNNLRINWLKKYESLSVSKIINALILIRKKKHLLRYI